MFDSMPKLRERSGASDRGSITGFYTILVDGDDMDEPVSDTVRGILDGHIVLSRSLAQRYHYPAIDVLGSVSRLSQAVSGPAAAGAAGIIRKHMAVYAEAEDLVNVGAYHAGSNPAIDEAVARHGDIENFLIQAVDEKAPLSQTLAELGRIAGVPVTEDETAGRGAADGPSRERTQTETGPPPGGFPRGEFPAGIAGVNSSQVPVF
ncbi:MAG: hypothetical protein LBG42_04925, partial [Treponema sp.]|jgi:flagellum-specific ATP synthase|nr:hypothetical protein [Treponema sp.]